MAPCSIRWCGKYSSTSNFKKDGITFHRYPKDPRLKQIWQNATRRENWSPSPTSVICSRHFEEDCFKTMKNRRRLLSSAVPTLFLPLLMNTVEIGIKQESVNLPPITIKHEPVDGAPIPIKQVPVDGAHVTIKQEPVDGATHTIKQEPVDGSPITIELEPLGVASSTSEEHITGDIFESNFKTSFSSTPETNLSSTPKTNRSSTPEIQILPTENPSCYNDPVQKRLCRRIIELSEKVAQKNRQIKNLKQKTLYMRKIISTLKCDKGIGKKALTESEMVDVSDEYV